MSSEDKTMEPPEMRVAVFIEELRQALIAFQKEIDAIEQVWVEEYERDKD
jgi:hypothetical protein